MTVWYAGRNETEFHSALDNRLSSTQSDKYQLSRRYGIFSWWWAHSCPKHVDKSNKHIKKICAPRWFYLQHYTEMQVKKTWKKVHKSVVIELNLVYQDVQNNKRQSLSTTIFYQNHTTCFGSLDLSPVYTDMKFIGRRNVSIYPWDRNVVLCDESSDPKHAVWFR